MMHAAALSLLTLSCTSTPHETQKSMGPAERWTEAAVNDWHNQQGWMVGCNYVTSSAVNQLEMWQADTFDPQLIDKELGWAKDLGFTSMRVFLHSLVWLNDSTAFKQRIDEYLKISTKNGIKTTFVLLDDCWNADGAYGKQPEPKTGVHNSGWIQDPVASMRKDTTTLYPAMEGYIKDILTTFKDDDRVLMWDIYNEPGNSGHVNASLPLLKKAFQWAREVNPSQPLTSGIWKLDLKDLNTYQLNHSDVISYHCYLDQPNHAQWVNWLGYFGRPMFCTEWMGRRFNSTFETIFPMLKENHIGAYCWGFVAGKTNTIFAWDDPRPDGKEPELWFHDIIRTDGTPYAAKEIETIKKLTLKNK